jgi:hypothetical protein
MLEFGTEPMRTLFTRVFRFFWSWGFLKFALGVVLLVILFYAEENWRGAAMWAATKKKWEAQGESFDYRTFIPPPVPDEQNLAALPVFELAPGKNGGMDLPKLAEALDDTARGGPLSSLSDRAHLISSVQAAYAAAIKGGTATDPLAQLEALYPVIADVRGAAASRSEFQLKGIDYNDFWKRTITPVNDQIMLAKLFVRHGLIALEEKRTDVALQDIKVNFILARGIGRIPNLVSGLVSGAIAGITREVVVEGLKAHAWSDAELATLEGEIARMDCLALYQFSLRGEFVTETVPMYDLLKQGPHRFLRELPEVGTNEGNDFAVFTDTWPSAWWDISTAKAGDQIFRSVRVVDPISRLVNAGAGRELKDESERRNRPPESFLPWNTLYARSAPVLASYTEHFAMMQVWLDQDRIVSALERYRLAKGKYPESPQELAPAYIDAVPHDIMNGKPYHYQLNEDGTFRLYSVGWDQVDDGGTVVFETNSPNIPSYEHGDWVWPGMK